MCAIQWFILKSCIFGLCISVTEAGVVLETSDGRTTYVIGSKVELVCSITPYNNEMTWFVNNDPYADCTAGTCNPYSNKAYAFAFTFNETAGIFKLAISSVTHSHADLLFACADGIERKPISFNVTSDNGTTSNNSNTPTKPDINNQITATSENSNDNSLSRDTKIGLGVGLGVGIPALIGIACGRALYRRWKRVNTIRDIKQRLQKDDKQELLKQIENKELEEIQDLKNRQEVIKGSLTEQSDEIKRNRRSLIKENDWITEQLLLKEAQYNTRHNLFPMEEQDNTGHSLFPMKGQDRTRYRMFLVDAINNRRHVEEQELEQNKAIDEYIKEDLLNNGIFSSVIMQDIEEEKKKRMTK